MTTPKVAQPPEQERYARWLDAGTRVGLLVSVLGFASYVFGWLPGALEPQRLSELWHLPVGPFLDATKAPTGWSWLPLIARGDMLALAGIALLAGCSIPPLLALVPLYLSRKDRVYAGLCIAVVAVICLAASGILSVGH